MESLKPPTSTETIFFLLSALILASCTSGEKSAAHAVRAPTQITLAPVAVAQDFTTATENNSGAPFTARQKVMKTAVQTSSFATESAKGKKNAPAKSALAGNVPGLNFANAPASNLVAYARPIQDQGSIGDCTAFAFTGMFEIFLSRFLSLNIKLSENFLWSLYRRGSITDAANAITTTNSVPEFGWPYLVGDFFSQILLDFSPPPGFSADALATAVVTQVAELPGAPADWIPVMINVLAQGYPVALGLELNDSFFSLDASNGIVAVSPSDAPQADEGHNVVVIGFLPSSTEKYGGYWILRNSWGLSWGLQGYGLLPLAYCLDYANGCFQPVAISTAALHAHAPSVSASVGAGWLVTTFQNILGRPASAAEIASWQGAVATDWDLGSVAGIMLSSDEYLTDQIDYAYQTYLHRSPEASAVTQDLAVLKENVYLEVLGFVVLGSEEYWNLNGANATGFATALYRDVLGRTGNQVSPTEITNWVAAQGAGMTRNQIATVFLTSPEYRGNQIKNLYSRYLLRTPGAGEVQNWLNYWGANKPRQQDLIAIFAGSPEYVSHFH